jgi:predicted nucleic acid-binding protein
MVLVDTSVWIDHLRKGNSALKELLSIEQVVCHSFILGELACGNLRDRATVLTLLRTLPKAPMAEDDEVLHLLDTRQLYGRGLGWVDVHLLASALLVDCAFWTLDRRLQLAAGRIGIPPR